MFFFTVDLITDALFSDDFNHILSQSYDVQNYTLGEPWLALSALRFGAIPSESLLESEWYFNGAQYISSSKLTLRDSYPVYDLTIEYPVLFDSGYYELILKFPFEEILRNMGCSREYGSRYLEFFQSDDFLGFQNGYFIADTATIEIRYTGKVTPISQYSSITIIIICIQRNPLLN